jgi:hypothetical protein
MEGLSTGSIGRRPKSAKAGNRGVWGTNGAAGAMGIWRRRECWGSCVDAVDRIALARILGVRAGANERIARCSTGFAVRSRGNLADRSKRVWCRPPDAVLARPISLASYPVATGRPLPGHQRPRARKGEGKGLTRHYAIFARPLPLASDPIAPRGPMPVNASRAREGDKIG